MVTQRQPKLNKLNSLLSIQPTGCVRRILGVLKGKAIQCKEVSLIRDGALETHTAKKPSKSSTVGQTGQYLYRGKPLSERYIWN